MNALLLNREGFRIPADGFYQIAPLGEFAHVQAGLVQVVDQDACEGMVNRFADEAKAANFAGLLVDFDHFSLDGEKRSEAAGWITALENRDGGLFAKIRWSDVGEEAVKGGRYRFLSPVWARSDCTDLGNGRVRPMRLLNAAVTNDPNLKGMQPLSNSAPTEGVPRFQWVLGDTKDGRHCPSCSALAGQVHTMAEWDAAGLRPGAAGLCCKGCQCSLEETTDGSRGALSDVQVRHGDPVGNRQDVVERSGGDGAPPSMAKRGRLVNTGWTNEARAASIVVRRAKALRHAQGEASRRVQSGAAPARKDRAMDRQRDSLDKASKDYSAIYEQKGLDGMTAEEQEYMTARVGQRMRNGSQLTPTEERFVREVRARDGGGGTAGIGGTIVKNSVEKAEGCRLMDEGEMLENVGWTDAARAASLAVRRAKAALRQTLHPQAQARGGGQGHSSAHGGASRTGASGKVQQMSPADQEAHQADVAEGAQGAAEDISAGGAGDTAQSSTDSRSGDMEGVFQEKGLDGMTTDQVIQFKDQLRDKLESGTEPLTPAEEGFLDAVTEKSAQDAKKDSKQYTAAQVQAMQTKIDQKRQRGDNLSSEDQDFLKMTDPGNDGIDRANGGDPIVQWQMHRQQQKQRIQQSTGMDANAAEAKAEDIQMRLDAGHAVSADERGFLNKMQKVLVQNRGDFYGDDAPYIEALVNTGWTDAARVAALAVRQAKGAVRQVQAQPAVRVAGGVQTQGVKSPAPQPGTVQTPVDGGIYLGGSKSFDESARGQVSQPAPVAPPTLPGQPSASPGRRYSIVPPGSGAVRVTPVSPGLPVQAGQTGQLKKKVAAPGTSGFRFMASRAQMFGG